MLKLDWTWSKLHESSISKNYQSKTIQSDLLRVEQFLSHLNLVQEET